MDSGDAGVAGSRHGAVRLKRSLSLPLVLFYGLGNILGAGIYVLIGQVAGKAGYLAPLSFLAAALTVTFSAFAYAELSARFPVSAGEAVYVQKGSAGPGCPSRLACWSPLPVWSRRPRSPRGLSDTSS